MKTIFLVFWLASFLVSKKTQKYHMWDETCAELMGATDLSSRAKPLPAS